MGTTSIQIDAATRKRLARLKSSPRETYDQLLNKLLALVPEGDDEGLYTDGFRVKILEGQMDARRGRVVSDADMKRRLGL